MPQRRYELLIYCEVIATTEKAIKVAWEANNGDHETCWIPRSLCEDGDKLDEGDEDIAVAYWFAIKNDLPI